MLDPSLPDRLIDNGSRLSLDALEYIDEMQAVIIEAQTRLIEANARIMAQWEAARDRNA